MSNSAAPIMPSQSSMPANQAPSASNATTAAAVASTHGQAQVNSASKINSMDDLRRKAPKVYNMMMQSLMESVRRDMQKHQERLKKAYRGDS